MKRFVIIILLGVLSWSSVRPLLSPGFFPMHDDTQVARMVVMGKALAELQFPVRWVADLGYGYGYPLFNFYGPLPYYIGGAAIALGLPALFVTKLIFIMGAVLLGVSTYILVSTFWGAYAGIIAATLALYAPYHAVQIYVRGALGELWASAFLPFVVLGYIYLLSPKTRIRGVVFGGVGLAAIILSHTISGYQTVIMLVGAEVCYVFYAVLKRRFHISILLSHIWMLFLGLGLSAFFWLPAIGEMQFTSVSSQIGASANFHDHFVCLGQLWDSLWGFGGSVRGCVDGLSFKLGKIHMLLAIIGVAIWSREKQRKVSALYWSALFLLLWSIFFMLPLSSWLWEHIPGFAYIQYPWRFLSIATLALAILGGTISTWKRKFIRPFVILFAVVLIIVVNGKWFVPQYLYQRNEADFQSPSELHFRVSRISDEYLSPEVLRPTNRDETVFAIIIPRDDATFSKSEISVQTQVNKAVYGRFLVTTKKATEIVINRAYFPGWEYRVNGILVRPYVTHGLPSLSVPQGTSTIEIQFRDTWVRIIANSISCITFVWLSIYYVKHKKTYS